MAKKTSNLQYEFGALDNGEHVGWNEPATIIFSHISRTLVREAMQNVIDATTVTPAVIKFSCLETPARKFIPEPEKLIQVYEACAEEVRDNEYAKERFRRAAKILKNNETIRVLKISDYHTTGLIGGDRQKGAGGNFFAFMHSVGVTSKGANAGGSFGLGKGSFYASSDLRTIFVTSKTADDHVFQGKLRLVTHNINGVDRQATGSYGLKGQKPLRGTVGLPSPIFKREEIGTDIYIPAYLGGDDWADTIIRAALAYFWLAILRGKIEVEVDGIRIGAENLEETIAKYFNGRAVDYDDPTPYLRAYTDKDLHKFFPAPLKMLGQVELYILLGEEYPSRVAYFRSTGMQIKTKTHRLPRDYAGVFVCDDPGGNELLKQMENATHDEWDAENANKYGEQIEKKGEAALKELQSFVRKSLDTLIDIGDSESITIPGVDNLISLPLEKGEKAPTEGDEGEEVIDIGTDTTVRRIPIVVWPPPPPPPPPDYESIPVTARSYAESSRGKTIHHLLLKGEPGQSIDIVDVAVGTEDGSETMTIRSANGGGSRTNVANNSEIRNVKLGKDGRAHLQVDFGDEEKYSLRVAAYKKLS